MWTNNYGYCDQPYPGGANALFVDNAVQWVSKVQPQETWLGANDYWWMANRMGYVPNPRLDEDAQYPTVVWGNDYSWVSVGVGVPVEPETKVLLELDMDDIYVDEQGWGPTDPGRIAGGIMPLVDDDGGPLHKVAWETPAPGPQWHPADGTHTSYRWYAHYWYTHGGGPEVPDTPVFSTVVDPDNPDYG
ncbi:MAG: hypothetical protein GTO03_10935, partial [Planctomycetales bacterium]|nr:hypothetical protein [Xanthomonadales bacterium]NIP86040.1 hypothetical protein [Planctomycetales bacterium]